MALHLPEGADRPLTVYVIAALSWAWDNPWVLYGTGGALFTALFLRDAWHRKLFILIATPAVATGLGPLLVHGLERWHGEHVPGAVPAVATALGMVGIVLLRRVVEAAAAIELHGLAQDGVDWLRRWLGGKPDDRSNHQGHPDGQ